MPPSQEPQGEVAALRERLSRLSEASRRINESLDFQTVLQGVLDSARDLTSSQYGVSCPASTIFAVSCWRQLVLPVDLLLLAALLGCDGAVAGDVKL